jgi:HK97 family phage major capsid protein
LKKRAELLNQKADLVKEMRAIHEQSSAGITPEMQASYDDKKAQVENINSLLKRDDELRALEREAGGTLIQSATENNSSANPLIKTPKLFNSLGEQLQAIVAAADHQVDPRLMELNGYHAAAAGGSSQVGSDGGFLIQSDFATDIQQRMYDSSVLASRCQKVSIGENANSLEAPFLDETSRATGSRLGGVRVYRTAEADTASSSKPKIGKFRIELEKLMGIAYCTQELLQDASAMSAIYQRAFSDEGAFVLDSEIFEGTGAGQCQGIKNAACAVTVAKESGQANTTIVYNNITNMWSRMWGRSRFNSVWLINQDVEPQLMNLALPVGTGGLPVYLPPGGLSSSPYSTLFGRPVIPIEQADTLGTKGDITLADLSQYMLIDKSTPQWASSMHVRFLTDEMTFKFTYRVNGKPIWQSALTPAKGSNTLSPFVNLANR